MIEQSIYEHLKAQEALKAYLATYNCAPAIFNQVAPADMDECWECGAQYGRIVFSVDIQGDPARTMGGVLSVDILCKEGEQIPEEIEPIIREVVHGYFFSDGTFTVAAQWKNSSYFTEPTNHVIGCTVTFDLLGFPIMTTTNPDVVERLNVWSSEFEDVYAINYDALPGPAWRPEGGECAVYWRLLREDPAGWIPDTFQTIWRTATIKGHIFAESLAAASKLGRTLTTDLYAIKRLLKPGEAPIMTNRKNTEDFGADPLRTGQLTVEATYGVIVHIEPDGTLENINY